MQRGVLMLQRQRKKEVVDKRVVRNFEYVSVSDLETNSIWDGRLRVHSEDLKLEEVIFAGVFSIAEFPSVFLWQMEDKVVGLGSVMKFFFDFVCNIPG